jgi:translocator protein
MNTNNKSYISLMLCVGGLIGIGWMLGSITKAEVHTWYSTLNRSALTPPSYMFGIVWTLLYAMMGLSAWILWRQQRFPGLTLIKSLYAAQLLLNWSWTPLFFGYHCIALSLIVLVLMTITVLMLIYLSYRRIRWVSLLMAPYGLWLLLATYLNFYIWQHN